MSRYKHTLIENVSVLDAVSTFYSDVASMAEEVREAYDNMPESLQNGQRGETLNETADTLEGIEEPTAPDCVAKIFSDDKLTISAMVLPGRQHGNESRATRIGNAANYASAVIDHVREWCDNHEEDETHKDDIDELTAWVDELEGHKDEAEGCEFPGMYG